MAACFFHSASLGDMDIAGCISPISFSVSLSPTLDSSAIPYPFFSFFLAFFLSSGWFCLQGCFKRPKATEFCAGSVLGYNDQLYDVRDEQGDYLM